MEAGIPGIKEEKRVKLGWTEGYSLSPSYLWYCPVWPQPSALLRSRRWSGCLQRLMRTGQGYQDTSWWRWWFSYAPTWWTWVWIHCTVGPTVQRRQSHVTTQTDAIFIAAGWNKYVYTVYLILSKGSEVRGQDQSSSHCLIGQRSTIWFSLVSHYV